MSAFIDNFTGKTQKKAQKQAAKDAAAAREQARLSQARQAQDVQNRESETATSLAALRRNARGRRLLMGDDAGGLASTLG